MLVTVLCAENSSFKEALETSAVHYIEKESEFHMDAGGYLLRTTKPLIPQKLESDARSLTVTFTTQREAGDFWEWLKSAGPDAAASFSRMLD